jgi:small GTP-binding protein
VSGNYSRISASGAAALQVWRLRADLPTVRSLLGLTANQTCSLNRPRLVRIAGAQDGELLDEALLCAKSAQEFEICLHGGLGVALAWRTHLAACGWTEEPRATQGNAAFLQARSPLQARWAWCAQATDARPLSLDQLRPWVDWARAARGDARLVIAGATNAGKSSLLNAWLRQERVTVSAHPGTTRDAVEAGVLIGAGASAFELQLVDTAGFWADAAGSDARAVEQSHRAIQTAWKVLWLVDRSQPIGPELMAALAQAQVHDLLLLSRADCPATASVAKLREAFPGRELGAWDLRTQAEDAAQACVQAIVQYLGPPPPVELALPISAEAWQELDAERPARG